MLRQMLSAGALNVWGDVQRTPDRRQSVEDFVQDTRDAGVQVKITFRKWFRMAFAGICAGTE